MLALLQFDSASLPLLARMLEEGRLPALADLRSRGRWHDLAAPDADIAAAVYHSLASGVEAGDHGLYHTFQWRAAEQRVRFIGTLPKPETAWERVSRGGGRSAIIDPFVSWPPRGMVGVCLSGWQYSNRIILQRWSVPAGELARLGKLYGRPRRLEETLGAPTADRLLRLSRRLLAAPGRAADAAVDLLGQGAFDLLWVNLAPAHFAGHWLWEPERLLGAGRGEELRSTLPDVYEATDRAIGRIVEALPPGADIMAFSPTGMGLNTSLSDLLPGMLNAVLSGARASRSPRARNSALWGVRGALPTSVRSAFSRAVPAAVNRELVCRLYLQGVDWATTRAFAIPGETQGLVRLNIRGRERDGIVDPSDAAALLDELAAGLATYTYEDGGPAVVGVERPQGRWPEGARRGELPDLLVRWGDRPADEVGSLTSPRFGTVVRPGVGTGWPGNHRAEAWAIVVPGTARPVEPSGPSRVVDIAATVSALTGADMSGLAGRSFLEPRF